MYKYIITAALLLFITACNPPTADAQALAEITRSSFTSPETVDSAAVDFEGRFNRIAITVPQITGTPTAILVIGSPLGQYVTKTAIAENTTTYLDATDFDAGLDYIHIEKGYTFQYTLSTAVSDDQTIVTILYGEEY